MRKRPALSVGLVFDDSLDSSDGVSQYVKTVGAWLTKQGHHVSYIVGQTNVGSWADGDVYSAAKNLRLSWGGNRLSMPVWPDKVKIRQLIKINNFDILHVQVPYSPLMAQYAIRRAKPSTAVVGTFHVFTTSWLSVWGSRLLKVVYGRSLRRFDAMLAVSPAARQYAQASFSLDTEISPNVVEASRFRPHKPVKISANQIVFLGRLVERKGCAQLLKAFKQLLTELPEAKLVIAGDGPLRRRLEEYVKQNDLAGSVSFVGFVSEKEKASLLAEAAIACFPSLYGESFGIVLIEAMAAGSGVVLGGDNPGYRTVLGDQADLLVDPANTVEFSGRLKKLLTDKALAEELHDWQSETVKQYDIETVGPKLVDIYRKQIAKRLKKSNN